MTAKVDSRLWFVRRSAGVKGRAPKLHFIRIASQTAKTVTLREEWAGRRRFKRHELALVRVYTTVGEALQRFYESAQHWRDIALEDVAHAERDIDWYRKEPLSKMLRYAREA